MDPPDPVVGKEFPEEFAATTPPSGTETVELVAPAATVKVILATSPFPTTLVFRP